MKKEFTFALYAIKKNIQSSAELRASFLMSIVGMAINNVAFIIVWVFFVQSVGTIGGWGTFDIIALQGITAFVYGIVFSFGAGLGKLPEYVTTGSFERFMLSPKNVLIRMATSSFNPSGVGDIIFGFVCFVIYGFLTKISILQILFLLLFLVFAAILFFSVTVSIFSISFLFTDASSVVSGVYELFFTPSLFHGGAFQGATRVFFMFVVPSLLVGTIPVEAVKELSLEKFAIVFSVTIFWFVLSINIFNRAIRRYESTNLMTFGG